MYFLLRSYVCIYCLFDKTFEILHLYLEKSAHSADSGVREVCVKIKREKLSLENEENVAQKQSDDAVFKLPAPIPSAKAASMEETTLTSSISLPSANTTTSKKSRKKKDIVHKPIKVERFSDLDSKPAPISSRTRSGSTNESVTQETKRVASVYEDAIVAAPIINNNEANVHTREDGAVNETLTTGPTADTTINLGNMHNDATFCANPVQTTLPVAPVQTTFVVDSNPNATITLNKHSGSAPSADATFDVHQLSKTSKEDDIAGQRSFETAKDTTSPNQDSLLTEDEQEIPTETLSQVSNANNKTKETAKLPSSVKTVYKMAARTKELFK